MRPIDADAFKKYIDAQEGRPFIGCTVGEAMKILIDEQPTVQPEPTDIDAREAVYNLAEKIGIHQLFALTVELRGEPIQPEPHEGHWIRRDCGLDVECKCSKCGYRDFMEPRDEYWFKRNYCPNCGAKMTISTK